MPTTEHEMKPTQRMTNLCISVTASRLLSYELVNVLELYSTGNMTDLEESKKYILKYQKEQSDLFIQKLVATCRGVISLDGPYDPGDFQIAAQEEKMGEYK